MMEMVMFAVILVAVQVLAGLALMRLLMTDFVMKKYLKFMKKYMNKLIEMEFENED